MNSIQKNIGRNAERNQWTHLEQNGRKEMVTDERASSWKKAMNSIQQNGSQEKVTDEKISSWKKAMNSIRTEQSF